MNYWKPTPILPADMPARYEQLCQMRDAINVQNAATEQELAKVNEQIEALRARSFELAEKIDQARGGEKWLGLKKEIGILAKALSGRR